MNSKIFFLGAIMLLPTFASCQQEKPFPDDAVDKVYEYLPEWQAGYLDIHQISTGRGNAARKFLKNVKVRDWVIKSEEVNPLSDWEK